MWPLIPAVAVFLAQAAPADTGSKSTQWRFDRGQDAQLCEQTEAECNRLRNINTEIAKGPCKPVGLSEIPGSPTAPRVPPGSETPARRWSAGADRFVDARCWGRWIRTSSSAPNRQRLQGFALLLERGVPACFPPAAYALLQAWQNRAPQASAPDRVAARYLRPSRGSA